MSGDEKLVALFELGLNASSMNARVTTAENNISHINKHMSFNENRLKLLEYKSIDAEARSRRNNLIFRGVGESLNPDSEDCEEKIREILRNDLRLDYDPVIQRAHRLGPINRRRRRTVGQSQRPPSGPSSAFEKWSGHEISKTFYECRRHELGESTRGGIPPLVIGVRGISPEKILYYRTSVQTILMHIGTIFALEALLIL